MPPQPNGEALGKTASMMGTLAPWLALAPVQYDETASAVAEATIREITSDLEALIFHAVRLHAYLEYRRNYNGDDAHEHAVRESNKQVKAVRTLMGYHTTHDLSF